MSPLPVGTDRPLVQDSQEFLSSTLSGPADQIVSLVAAQIEIAVAPVGGSFGSWILVDDYDPDTGIALFEVGPTTSVGQLALGINQFRIRITDSSERPVLVAGALEVIA